MSSAFSEQVGIFGRKRGKVPGALGIGELVEVIIDNGEPGYSSTSGFTEISGAPATIQQNTIHASDEFRDHSNTTWLAQGFVATATSSVESWLMSMAKVGSPAGDIWAEIWSDDGAGNPNAIIGGPSDAINTSAITSQADHTFSWSTNKPNIVNGVQYHVVLKGNFTINSSNYIRYWYAVGNVYAGGLIKKWNGSSWGIFGSGENDARFVLGYASGPTDAHNGSAESAPAGSGSENATWTASNIPLTSNFSIDIKYPTIASVATDAPFSMSGKAVDAVDKDQSSNPGTWVALFTNNAPTNAGDIVVQLTDDANGIVLADAVRLKYIVGATKALDDTQPSTFQNSSQISIPFSALLANDVGTNKTITQVSNAVGCSVSISGENVLFTPSPGFIGNATFKYTLQADEGNDVGTVTTPILALLSGAFLQSSGAEKIASMEAENFHANVNSATHSWVADTTAGASGSALRASPDIGTTESAAAGPKLSYIVNFVATGTHYVWVRARAPALVTDNDSLHSGINGVLAADGTHITRQLDDSGMVLDTWVWICKLIDGGRAQFSVPSVGDHTVNVWMRKDGLIIDKVVLTTDVAYDPSIVNGGLGPIESQRAGTIPTITDAEDESFFNAETGIVVTGLDFGASQGAGNLTLRQFVDGSGAVSVQTIESWSDTSLQFTCVQGGIPNGLAYLFVEADSGLLSPPLAVTIQSSAQAPTANPAAFVGFTE